MTSKIKKVTHKYAWELTLARMDHAAVTGQAMIERPFWYENIETGQEYYDLYGCVGWPTEATDTSKGMPGYVAVIGVVKSNRPIQEAWFRLMAEAESEYIHVLFDSMVKMREEYGFGLHPGLMQTYFGDPDKHLTRLALYNEKLVEKDGPEGAILIAPPDEFYDSDPFENYRRSFETAIVSTPERFAFGGNSILKTKHRQYRVGDPAVFAVGGLVHSLLSRCTWMDQARENAFNVEEEDV